MTTRKGYWLIHLLWMLALILSACGQTETPEPVAAPDEPAVTAPAQAPKVQGEAPASPPADVSGATEPPAQPDAATSGKSLVADFGFRPEKDGFSFENYGEGTTNLTPADMEMIFGDVVCANKKNGKCTLTPPADEWMQQENKDMNGGHCFGLSVASLRFYQKQIQPATYGGNTTAELKLQGNEALQREIARSFEFQVYPSVQAGMISGSPTQILDKLLEAFATGPGVESYTAAVKKPDGSEGHAVTPYAIEDRGSGQFAILVYDNNWPGQSREILVDRNTDQWSFEASINPDTEGSLYEGNAETQSLVLYPTTPGVQKQPCTFCAGGGVSRVGNGLGAPALQYNTIYLDGSNPANHAHLLITSKDGKRYGYTEGKFVTEIPGVTSRIVYASDRWQYSPEPVYNVPLGMEFTLTIDGSSLKEVDSTDVVIIGPGYYIGVEDVSLDPGQKDTLTLSADSRTLTYQTEYAESPTLVVGHEAPANQADYEFAAKGVEITPGGSILIAFEPENGILGLSTANTQSAGKFELSMTRITEEDEVTFDHDEILLNPGDILYFYYEKWTGQGGALEIGIDQGGKGTIDETITVPDK